MKLVADSFLASYRKENGVQAIANAKGVRYLVPFQAVVAPGMVTVIRDSMAHAVQGVMVTRRRAQSAQIASRGEEI
jgi:hypothetical protein